MPKIIFVSKMSDAGRTKYIRRMMAYLRKRGLV